AVFVENQSGSLRKVTTVLHGQKLNIYAFASFDTPEFGILRMLVDRPEEAKDALTSQGFVTRVCDVIAVELPDEQGGMDSLLAALHESNISINYTYSSFGRMSKVPAVVIHTDEVFETENVLKSKGFVCMESLSK
ncbi:MAG: amino acid-binding protein, partial [Lachnospiraceae bacterium]|nr:amino acid-binding protein [Lachnospiraceae bacterium]